MIKDCLNFYQHQLLKSQIFKSKIWGAEQNRPLLTYYFVTSFFNNP